MAGIFGVVRANGAPADRCDLAAMRKAMEIIPAMERPTWVSGPAALGACIGHPSVSGSDAASGIATMTDAELAIVADVRIDNRGDLAERLGIGRSGLADLSDAQLILLGYQKWGEDCPKWLLGDFVFVIWDARLRTCLLARDHLGVKPLFLYQDSSCLVFATDVAGVLGHPHVTATLSDEAIADFLGQGELYSVRQTFYRDIQKLPPATCLKIESAKRTESVYWDPAAVPRLDCQATQDYVLRLQELFESAVAVRLPASGVVGAHLSGGLDSSAICAQASKCGADLKAWSWMRSPRSESEKKNAEWARAALVADRLGIDLNWTDIEPEHVLGFLDTDILSSGDSTNLYYEYWVRPAVVSEGAKVMLSGWGGDQFVSNHGRYRYFETFWEGDPVATLAEMWRHATMSKLPIKRFMGLFLRRILLPLKARRGPATQEHNFLRFAQPWLVESWLEKQVGKESGLSDFCIRSQQLNEIGCGHLRNRLEGWAVAGRRQGIEYRYPLLDKRIVEFALGLPAELYLQQGFSRYIFRAAMSGMLPRKICWQNAKLEPVRVREGIAAAVRSVSGLSSTNPGLRSKYIDIDELHSWLGGVSLSCELENSQFSMDLTSAFLAKLLLNLEARSG